LHPVPFPSVASAGKALPVTALVEADFVVHNNPHLLLVSNVGNAGTVGLILEIDESTGNLLSEKLLTFPTLAQADDNGGPTAGRAMKFSVAVTNATPPLQRGGRVTYLNCSQRLPGPAGTPSTWTGLDGMIESIKSYPLRRRVTGDSLGVAKQLVGFVCDQPSYNGFGPWRGTLNLSEFTSHVMGASTGNPTPEIAVQHQLPMIVAAWVFDSTTEAQSYSITVRGSYYTRWPLTTVPGQTMKNTPTAPQASINQQHDKAEDMANELHAVGQSLWNWGKKTLTYGAEGLARAATPAAENLALRAIME